MRVTITLAVFTALVITLSTGQATAQMDLNAGKPGQLSEAVSPTATVVDTVHYQASMVLSCFGNGCSGDFPRPGARRRLKITRLACRLVGATNVVAMTASVTLQKADNSFVWLQYLPFDSSVVAGGVSNHTLNQAIDVQISSSQHINVSLLTDLAPTSAVCSVTGTRDTLQ